MKMKWVIADLNQIVILTISQSKLKFTVFVKEQRVDGSYCTNIKNLQLRCTLKGGASYYQTKIPSKQIVIHTKKF
jgi:hypothetical protein